MRRPTRPPKTVCVRRAGASRQQCPSALAAPRFYTDSTGTPLAPVLVGNTYSVDLGRWRAYRRMKFSVQWLDGHGYSLTRSLKLKLTPGLVGQIVAARACTSVSVATSCITLRLPERTQTVAGYLDATCGARRPSAPVYDPNFAFLSAPQVAMGWDPCRPIAWAIDDYGEPALSGPIGTSWQTLATSAIGQVAAATGVAFVQAPDFSAAPGGDVFSIRAPVGVDLSIGFAPQPAGVEGRGGPVVAAGTFTRHAGVELSSASWSAPRALVTLLHELGHAMGLAHPVPKPPAADPGNEIMDPAGGRFGGYQPGDLCGLYEITWQQPCAGAAEVTLGQGTVPG